MKTRRNYFLAYQLVRGREILSSNFEIFVPYKYLALQNPELTFTLDKKDNDLIANVSAKKVALFVELGLKDSYARFSDNYFHLLPGESKAIRVRDMDIPESEFETRFYVKSLIDAFIEN